MPHILLIDDNAQFREVVGLRLKKEGFEVTDVGSGQEGLAAAGAGSFDLILLDMLMPEKDGIATYQELKASPATRHIPVILLTAAAVEGHWEVLPYETDGPAFVMGKPYDSQMLLARIRQILVGS
ncbi:MAG: two-component system response regulator [Candidatus Omnitrophica bacterium CG11_big_fil_rev_8_21_14_0_20_63_9]|nr:MAG: two-component system response regulator [Candidatus Omnitrophica bacterium CG11_big_fil_rev_8_21_14_0_20_63_9]